MKSTSFNILSGNNWFETNIYRAVGYMATITGFIIASMKKTSELVTAIYLDRDSQLIDGKGVVAVGELGMIDYSSAQGVVPVVEFTGERDPNTRLITFGVGAVTPTNVKTALSNALQGLSLDDQIENSLAGLPGVMDALKNLVSPRLAETRMADALNVAFDLLPLIRQEVQNYAGAPIRLVVQFDQGENTGTIKILGVPEANLPNLGAAVTLVRAEVTPPELPSVTAVTPRKFGE